MLAPVAMSTAAGEAFHIGEHVLHILKSLQDVVAIQLVQFAGEYMAQTNGYLTVVLVA